MKKGFILATSLFFGMMTQVSYANNSTTTVSFSAIHSCDSYNQEVQSKILSTTIKNTKNITQKLADAKKYATIMKVWAARCSLELGGKVSVNNENTDPKYFVFANTNLLGVYTEQQQKEISQRVTIYKNIFFKTVDDMITKKLITPDDKTLMKGKVTLQYVANCNEFDGKISLKQWYDSNKSRVKNELIGFNINVNICFESWFDTNLESSVSQIMAHELGHFFYYFHDQTPKSFESICWTPGSDKSTCNRKAFVSEYAMSSPEEDYAESFAFRFLDKPITPRSQPLAAKNKYFDTVLSNLK